MDYGLDPRTSALMAMSQAFTQAGAPSRMPVSGVSALGMGLGAGLPAYQSAMARKAMNDALAKGDMKGVYEAMLNSGDPEMQKLAVATKLQGVTPKWEITKDAMGNPIAVNSLDPSETKPIGGGSSPFSPQTPGAGTDATKLTGDDYLATLQPNIASQVKALAEGKMQFPGGFALKSPYWQQMISAVSQYDPNFDAVNYNSRNTTRKDFTSGKSADNITALNTAMAHLHSLKTSYDSLGNGDYPMVNAASNWLGNQFGDAKVQGDTATVGANAEAVAHELAKVFRSTGMSEGEVNAWKEKITTSATPAQSKAVLSSAIDLMNGRLQALGERYSQGMGTTKSGIELLSPEAQAAYKALNGEAPASNDVNAPTPGMPPSAAAPSAGTPKLAGPDKTNAIFKAKSALAKGAPRDAVLQRLQSFGITPEEAGF